MAKRKMTRDKPVELPVELRIRKLEGQLREQQLRVVLREQTAMLSTYAAADKGRRNKDFRAANVSADQAIIPDSETINARSRMMVRDTGVAKSVARAFKRNVIRCGIIPVPQAYDANGKLLTKFNKATLKDFWYWANDKNSCDLERRQTFWAKQGLCETERVTVGQAFLVWSYTPPTDKYGKIDLRQPVGLRFQSFEAEQLDHMLNSFEGNEVRGGIEMDEFGAAIAYHVWTRHPNDYAFNKSLKSVRIDASRVLHYMQQDRVKQSQGVSDLSCSLQDMRDLGRGQSANLWRMIMEANIGLKVKRAVGASGDLIKGVEPRGTGDSGKTASGAPTIDFMPGMVADPGPGIELESHAPQAPGNQYAPFTQGVTRNIGAGVGLSYGQVARQSEGNYSAARQDMLEDRNEFEPLQELMAHSVVLPVWRLFVSFGILEGRFEVTSAEFASDPRRFLAAEYVAPAQPWIDPEKEINAYTKAIDYKLRDRASIISLQGDRREDVWDRIENEQNEAEERGIALPEDAADGSRAFKREAVRAMIADRAVGPIVANSTDIGALLDETGIPKSDYKQPELPIGNPIPQPANPPADKPALPAPSVADVPARLAAMQSADVAPNYHEVTADMPARCAACRYFVGGKCQAYDFAADANHVCDAFEAPPPLDGTAGRVGWAPGVQSGERPIDDVRGRFIDRGARGVLSANVSLAAKKTLYDFSSTQVIVPEPLRTDVLKMGGQIAQEDLAANGLEGDVHVTVKYGLHADNAAAAAKMIAGSGPVTATAGATTVFAGKDADVVVVQVDSPDLQKLNGLLRESLPHTETFPTYQPHITIAYVKSGSGEKYAGMDDVQGKAFTVDSIVFSDKDGNRTVIPLTN